LERSNVKEKEKIVFGFFVFHKTGVQNLFRIGFSFSFFFFLGVG